MGSKMFDRQKGSKKVSAPPQLAHEYMHTHIHINVDTCANHFSFYTLTWRYTFSIVLNRVVPIYGLRRKQICLCMREKVLYSSELFQR